MFLQQQISAQQNILVWWLAHFQRRGQRRKVLGGRVVRFSCIKENKRARKYSSNSLDLTKELYIIVGVSSNRFQGMVP